MRARPTTDRVTPLAWADLESVARLIPDNDRPADAVGARRGGRVLALDRLPNLG